MAADDVHVAYSEEEKQYRKAGRMLSELWYQDGINNVDNTVSALNIGLYYYGPSTFIPMTQPTVLFNLERSTLPIVVTLFSLRRFEVTSFSGTT